MRGRPGVRGARTVGGRARDGAEHGNQAEDGASAHSGGPPAARRGETGASASGRRGSRTKGARRDGVAGGRGRDGEGDARGARGDGRVRRARVTLARTRRAWRPREPGRPEKAHSSPITSVSDTVTRGEACGHGSARGVDAVAHRRLQSGSRFPRRLQPARERPSILPQSTVVLARRPRSPSHSIALLLRARTRPRFTWGRRRSRDGSRGRQVVAAGT